MRNLISELLERKAAGRLSADEAWQEHGPHAPLTAVQLAAVETGLGFALPSTLRALYTEVANGGFGPQYGLLGLSGGMLNEDGLDALRQYQAYRTPHPRDPYWGWPHGLIPLGHLGCAMYLCVDCTAPHGPVTWFEPNPHSPGQSWADSYIQFAESTDTWLLAWLDGKDLFDKLVEASME